MSTTIIPSPNGTLQKKSFWLDGIAKSGILKRLEGIRHGRLRIVDGEEVYSFGHVKSDGELDIIITVNSTCFYSSIAFAGSVGAGESYISGDWCCSDLTGLVRLLLQNREVLDGMDSRWARLQVPLFKLFHWLNRNTRRGSRRNISAHYDLGNEMFELFLDSNMIYSSAIYPNMESGLEEASLFKLQRICQKLQLNEKDHLLEIGTGWGGLAIYAAQHCGCRVTTTTISQEQYELALSKVAEAGLTHQITVLLKDYRDLDQQYDKLVSIEMIEAIGHHYMDTYFKQCSALLKPEGMMLLQAITIADQRYQEALTEVDFIKRFIFPGCFIPSTTAMLNSITQSSDMTLSNLENIGPHYARTLRDWSTRFFASIDQVRQQGYRQHSKCHQHHQ